jgi:hypothetical protein
MILDDILQYHGKLILSKDIMAANTLLLFITTSRNVQFTTVEELDKNDFTILKG